MDHAILNETVLVMADLAGVDLCNVTLRDATLDGVNMSNANLVGQPDERRFRRR